MNAVKRILVPTDFSKNSENANRFAIELANKSNAELLFFHAYHIPVNDPISPVYSNTGAGNPGRELMEEHEKVIREKLINLCNEMQMRSNDHVKCNYMAKAGFLVDQIINTIREEQIDMVIMGARGASGITENLFGSNTSSVVEKADCPVLTVPVDAGFKNINHVLYATDFIDGDVLNVKRLAELITPFSARVHVVHVTTGIESDREVRMEGFRQLLDKQVSYEALEFHEFENDKPIRGLGEAIRVLQADMVAMVRRKKGFFQEIFQKDLTTQMTENAHLPTLVFHHVEH